MSPSRCVVHCSIARSNHLAPQFSLKPAHGTRSNLAHVFTSLGPTCMPIFSSKFFPNLVGYPTTGLIDIDFLIIPTCTGRSSTASARIAITKLGAGHIGGYSLRMRLYPGYLRQAMDTANSMRIYHRAAV